MKSKKVYIGISIGAILVICIIVASIFYIKTKNKDVEQADFTKNITNEDTKEAMEITEEKDEAKEITNEVKSEEADQGEIKQEEVKKDNTKQKETKKVEEKKEIIVTDMKKTLYVKATSLNVRSGPSTSDSKIGAYKNAAEVTVTGKVKDSTWYRVSYNGKVGYVDSTYLTETKPVVEEKSYEEEYVSTTGSTVSNLIVINSRNNTLR